uniref:PSP domain-containing protein n=1 Tax=Haemonchus contortus TaxID=6289 RepID=A0A7I4YE70_HAECO|nr:PSP domain containing protein [Haemonchus contortus]
MTEEAQSTRFDSDDEEGRCTPSPEPETKKRRLSDKLLPADVMKGNEADYGDFVLDRTESMSIDADDLAILDSTSGKEDCSTWKEKVLSSLLTGQEDENGNRSAKKNPPKKNNGCFNCDGDHHLNECPEPKDMRKIRQRQTEMRSRNSTTRYHDGTSSEKKFRAGRISDDLRNALGIGKHDIPEYIYRMRRMGFIRGYPPGYLKKAIDRDDSNEVLKFHMVDEKSSCKEERSDRPDSPPPIINADRMIYYCGFNQYYRDLRDYENFRVPPFHEFVAFHQETLNKMHERKLEERRRRREREAKLPKKPVDDQLEDGEVIILEPPPPPPEMANDDDDVIIIDCEPRKTPSPPIETCSTPKGCSTGIMLGTPVLTRKRNGEECKLCDESKPSLENFSKGIVPFEAHEEETPHKGFLKKIMSKLKKITR